MSRDDNLPSPNKGCLTIFAIIMVIHITKNKLFNEVENVNVLHRNVSKDTWKCMSYNHITNERTIV